MCGFAEVPKTDIFKQAINSPVKLKIRLARTLYV